jgi:hypothetical protein
MWDELRIFSFYFDSDTIEDYEDGFCLRYGIIIMGWWI